MKVCTHCGEHVLPGQGYYSAPNVEHVMCRRARETGMELGKALHELQILRQAVMERGSTVPIAAVDYYGGDDDPYALLRKTWMR
jgi:hypothetical protein